MAEPGGPLRPRKRGEDETLRVSPNKNRLIQVRRTGGRKLFDGARKAVFVEWFAATCNISLSAEKAGICYSSVFRHLEKDPAFAAACDAALRRGYFRLEARSLQEAHVPAPAANPSTIASSGNGPPPPGELGEEYFDPQLALQLLREHARRLAGSPDKRKNLRTTARAATEGEVIAALEKRLKGFALRQRKRRKG